ncbi:Phosphoesterase [Burkholderiales bacterium 8X]|nr:Phosphoesterase [Burkholderiales bacterium 8X]
MARIGLISDTHDLLRPEALAFLRGSDHIIHAGDICTQGVIDTLAAIAPTTVVRGNNDRGDWAKSLGETARLQVEGVRIFVIHDISELAIDPASEGVRVVVYGHSHMPKVEEREGVLFVNPGSAGRRRFKLPIGVGELIVEGVTVLPRLVQL